MNPDPALAHIGQPAQWDPTRAGWTQVPYGFDGGIRMRYWYVLGPDAGGGKVDDVTFFACGSFPGFGSETLTCLDSITGNYQYSERVRRRRLDPAVNPFRLLESGQRGAAGLSKTSLPVATSSVPPSCRP